MDKAARESKSRGIFGIGPIVLQYSASSATNLAISKLIVLLVGTKAVLGLRLKGVNLLPDKTRTNSFACYLL